MDSRVAIVGGGPAGLIAAQTLAEAEVKVTIYEQMRSVGRKFLLAGRGGLNITHSEPLDRLLSRYSPNQQPQLVHAIGEYGPEQLQHWCSSLGEATFTGSSGRVFPQSFRATPLLRAWLQHLDALGVTIATRHQWQGWNESGGLVLETTTEAGPTEVVDTPEATLFALGGASWPRVGSDGSWVKTLTDSGIAVAKLQPANSGITVNWSSVMTQRFAGVPIKNATFTVGDHQTRGDAVVTTNGLEGGPIYGLGPALRAELERGQSGTVRVDLHPDLTVERLAERLANRRPKASITSWLASARVAPVAVALAREVTANQLPEDPDVLAGLLKGLPVTVSSLAPLDRAISTAGGIAWSEIDEHFMLRQRPGTFVAGEMLDWEAPTGGYLLQACFSTGVAAAQGVLRRFG